MLPSPVEEFIADDATTLAELEQLQQELYQHLVKRFGLTAASGVLGRALAGGGAAAAAAAAAPAAGTATATATAIDPAAATAKAAAGKEDAAAGDAETSSLPRSQSLTSDISDSASDTSDASSRGQQLWRRAVLLANASRDPWAGRGLHKLPMEVAVRFRYTATTRQWVKDDVLVKIEQRPFAAGAMRECFAMKKLSTFSTSVYRDWRRAPNFVAKRYKKPVEREVYFADVVLQMDAKFLGDEYNKTNPPKKVDFMQAAVIELKDRPGKPVMCVEHLIEGDYVKYNSNSGYVAATNGTSSGGANGNSSGVGSGGGGGAGAGGGGLHRQLSPSPSNLQEMALRSTPQAFSHFTYDFTRGAALCVDIQGVGDLYTDPQIHTLDGIGYGDGNLALRGMALFFRTHECNMLCSRMGLKPFDRCAPDVAVQGYTSGSSSCSGYGTLCRTVTKNASFANRLLAHRQAEQQLQPFKSLEQFMAQLADVPLRPSADAMVHFEVARIYAETVTLPELRPEEDADDARPGGLFHLTTAAAKGLALAQLVLACAHMGLQPSSTQLSHLVSAAASSGEFKRHPQLALRYTQLAAQQGIRPAAAALAYAYMTGEGVGAGALDRPRPAQAVYWLRKALRPDLSGAASQGLAETFSATPDGLNPRAAGAAAAASAASPSPGRPGLNPSRMMSFRPASRALRLGPAAAAGAAGQAAAVAAAANSFIGSDGFLIGSMFTLADHLAAAAEASLAAARGLFDDAAEEEAKLLPGGTRAVWELWADLGELLLVGAPAAGPEEDAEEAALLPLMPDPAAAAEAFNTAAEEASSAFKGKLAQRYYERAAEAEGAAAEVEGDEC